MSASPAPPRPAAAHKRFLRAGWPAVLAGILAFVHLGFPVLAAGLAMRNLTEQAVFLLGADALVLLVSALLLHLRVRKVAPGTRGRGRLATLAVAQEVTVLGVAVLTPLLFMALADTGRSELELLLPTSLEDPGGSPILESVLMVASAQGTYYALVASATVAGVGSLVQLGAALSAWQLVAPRVRLVFWRVADSFLLGAFVWVTLTLPLTPAVDDPGWVLLPAIRLAVTVLFGTRALVRILPFVLDGIESAGFRLHVAARMLRAKASGFLTAIGLLAILAVSVSSCMLTTTLSIMGGFRNDLKRKILGHNAHVVVDREAGTFDGWVPVLDRAREHPEVVGASPFLTGEVMITSASNLAGASLRGIDPRTIADVSELPSSMRHGQLEYLEHPERLLRLNAEEMRRGLLSPRGRDTPPPPPLEGERGSLLGDIDRAIDEAMGRVAPPSFEEQRARELDEELAPFLLPPEERGPPEEEEEAPDRGTEPGSGREVLPGLIVGQELARTLRLHVGDEVNVVSPLGELGPAGPMPRSRPFRVAGIFYSGMYEYDMKLAYTTLDVAQSFLNTGDAVSGIEVKVVDVERAESVATALSSMIGRTELRVRSWQEVNRNLFGALALEKLAMFITLGIAILVASFCVVGTLTLMVQEKAREVGILKAMGGTSEQIVAVFMAQGLMIGLLGAVIGLGYGYVACFIVERFSIRLNPGVYYIDRLPVHIDPTEFILVGVSAVVVCLLATIYPAILGSRLRPIDALRYT